MKSNQRICRPTTSCHKNPDNHMHRRIKEVMSPKLTTACQKMHLGIFRHNLLPGPKGPRVGRSVRPRAPCCSRMRTGLATPQIGIEGRRAVMAADRSVRRHSVAMASAAAAAVTAADEVDIKATDPALQAAALEPGMQPLVSTHVATMSAIISLCRGSSFCWRRHCRSAATAGGMHLCGMRATLGARTIASLAPQ